MTSRVRFVFALYALASVATVFLFYAIVGAQTNPTLPQATVDTTYNPPTVGTTYAVHSGGNLQAAINNAQPGDIIQLQAGATFTGNFVLPKKTGSGWIYIRTSDYANLPRPGTRVSPSDASHMARLQTTNNSPVLRVDWLANQYRFVGIDFYNNYSILKPQTYNTILVGYNSSGASANAANLPDGLIFDRCWIHGHPSGSVNAGLLLAVKNFGMVDSYLNEIHSSYDESHGVELFKVLTAKFNNNYIEASGINMLIGDGRSPTTDLRNYDITVTNNHFFKPLSWKGVWAAKNDWEIKFANRVLAANNIMENSWPDQQSGFCVLINSNSTVTNVTFRNNIVRGCEQGFQINDFWDNDGDRSSSLTDLLLENNLIYNITGNVFNLGRGVNPTINFTMRHNTVAGSGGGSLIFFEGPNPIEKNWTVVDNIYSYRNYGIIGQAGTQNYKAVTYHTTNYNWNNNVIIGGVTFTTDANFRNFYYAANNAAVGFTNTALANPEDFRLAVSSPYKGKATEGKDIGADIDAILNRSKQPVTAGAAAKF